MREVGDFSRFCQVIAGIRFCIHYSGRRCSLKHQIWKPFALWILLAEGVGALAGWLTREGARIYSAAVRKPPLTPPGPVFPIVWSILFALMGIGTALVWRKPASRERTRSLILFIVQLAVNFFWSAHSAPGSKSTSQSTSFWINLLYSRVCLKINRAFAKNPLTDASVRHIIILTYSKGWYESMREGKAPFFRC